MGVALELPFDTAAAELVEQPHGVACPFPAKDATGGILLRWGTAAHGRWGEYSVMECLPRCVHCHQLIGVGTGTGVGSRHKDCAARAVGDKVTAMATFKITRDLPDCRACGRPFEYHDRPMTVIWDAQCDTDVEQYWRPAQPFRSRNWPFPIVVDSPRYTTDGEIAYAEAA